MYVVWDISTIHDHNFVLNIHVHMSVYSNKLNSLYDLESASWIINNYIFPLTNRVLSFSDCLVNKHLCLLGHVEFCHLSLWRTWVWVLGIERGCSLEHLYDESPTLSHKEKSSFLATEGTKLQTNHNILMKSIRRITGCCETIA